MDSQDLSKATTASSSSLNDEEKSLAAGEEDSLVPVSKRDRFLSTYRRQNFALPDSIMHYIAMNPATPKVYQSLIKSSKYFFHKNPIIFLTDAVWDGENWRGDVNGRRNINDLSKLCSRLWIDGRFMVYNHTTSIQCIISNIIPRFYRFDANELILSNQDISYNDYVFLSSSVESVSLNNVTIKDENDSSVALEKLVETAAKASKFSFSCNTSLFNCVTSKTARSLFENPGFSRLTYFYLKHVPQAFDIEVFYEYMKKNKITKLELDFDDTISDAYKARLNAIIDEILGTKTFDYKPSVFYFDGIDFEKYCKLELLHYR